MIKALVMASLIVVLLQIKVGDKTLETRTYQILAHSDVGQFLTGVAHGIVRLGFSAKTYIKEQINKTEPSK